jgi:PII-like signaling protein
MHSSSILDISSNLPVVIEIVDQEEALVNLVRALSEVIKEGVATLEKVRIYKFGQTL